MLEAINRFFKKHPKLSYIGLAVFLILVEVGFSFCSKKKCGGFADANFDNWFPYKEGQTLYFASSNNNRDTFSGLTIYKSQPFETSGGYGNSGKCHTEAYINSKYVLDKNLQIDYYISGETGQSSLRLTIKNYTASAISVQDSGLVIENYFTTQPTKTTYYDTYNFNGINYNKLQIIESDTTGKKTNAVYKVWLAKNVGIVGYESYPSLERWAKQ